MLLLFPNTQRQGVLMTPDGPCVGPQTAHSSTSGDFLTIVTPAAITGYGQIMEAGGGGWGLYGCFEKMCEIGVWVLRLLAQLGVYCAGDWAPYWHPWSPPLTQKLCSTPCVFLSTSFSLRHLPLLLSLTLSHPVSAHLPPPVLLSLRSPVGVHWIHTNSCEWRQVIKAVFHISVWKHVIQEPPKPCPIYVCRWQRPVRAEFSVLEWLKWKFPSHNQLSPYIRI